MDPDTDIRILIEKARKKDKQAFGMIYDRYVSMVYRFIYMRVGVKEDAEDITESVFVSMLSSIHTYTDRGLPFEAWMYRIARNKITDFYRTRKSHKNIDAIPELADTRPSPEQTTEQNYTIKQLHEAMHAIPPQYREILILKFIEGRSNEEVSAILEKTVLHVRVLQHRAVVSLKKVLKELYDIH